MDKENYRDINAVNQSTLKKILNSPKEYLSAVESQKEKKEFIEEHFIFGDIVDIMLVGNKAEFDKKYVKIKNEETCSETIKIIVRNVVNATAHDPIKEFSSEKLRDLILKFSREENYQNNYKDDTLVAAVIKAGQKYYEQLIEIGNKIPVTENLYSKAVMCVAALKSDKYTQKYTFLKSYPKGHNVEFLDRYVVNFEFKGVQIKGELDRVVIDHTEKWITPIDFKTTGTSNIYFSYDFWKLRYDFQSATYTIGLLADDLIKKYLEKGYILKEFKYIVVEKANFNPPLIYSISADIINIGRNGGTLSSGKKLEGLSQAIDRYKFHKETDQWDYPQEYYLHEFLTIQN